jgi:hypothetical protein
VKKWGLSSPSTTTSNTTIIATDEPQVTAREERTGIQKGPFHAGLGLVSDVSEDVETEKDAG